MSNVRVCVDVVGGDEKPQVVLDGIEAALAADPDIEVLAAGPAEIVNPHALAISSVGWSFSTADSCGEPPTKSPVDTGIILPGLWLSATVKAVALSAPRSICP